MSKAESFEDGEQDRSSAGERTSRSSSSKSGPEEIVLVAIGANLGDREATFVSVLEQVETASEVDLLAASPLFETAPVGPEGQGAYLNGAFAIRTSLAPLPLLRWLQAIEIGLGRDRSDGVAKAERWGPRTLDLDILFFGDRVIDVPDLIVPHPRAHERAFVMTPVAELAPAYRHPVLHHRLDEIAAVVSNPAEVQAWPRPDGWPLPSRIEGTE